MISGKFYVCSTDETHDIICVSQKYNGYGHCVFEFYNYAKREAKKIAKQSASYYVEDDELEYVIIQDIENDCDFLTTRVAISKALELANEDISIQEVLEDEVQLLYVLNELLTSSDILGQRNSEERKLARFYRTSKNNKINE